jgi:hypothetical protein
MVRELRSGVLRSAAVVVCGLFALRGASLSAETIDRVLAVAAGQVILMSDVTAARELGMQTADGGADPIRILLNKLIDRELVLAEVDRYAPPEPGPAAVDRGVATVRDRFPSRQAYASTLERSGLDESHVREMVRQDLRVVAYLNQRFATAGDRRQQLINDWMAGLRRRADVIDMYLTRD